MKPFRGLAILVLAFSILGPIGSAVVLAASAASHDLECTCPHGSDRSSCPMHRQSRDPKDVTRCRLQNARTPDDAVFTSLFGSMGVPPSLVTAPDNGGQSSPRVATAPRLSSRTTDPHPRPPRA